MSGPLRSESWAQHAADASRFSRRTPEAQADIAAARAAPTAMEQAEAEHLEHDAAAKRYSRFRAEVAAEAERAEVAGLAGPQCAHAMLQPDCPHCEAHRRALAPDCSEAALDTALSNAALADTPAVREMGGPAQNGAFDQRPRCLGTYGSFHGEPTKCSPVAGCGLRGCPWQRPGGPAWHPVEAHPGYVRSIPPDAIVLTGPEAERYRALQTAARKAQASAVTARADGAALLQLFQAFCAGVAPAKEG